MSSSTFSVATATRRTAGSVAVGPPAIVSRPFIVRIGNAGAADATRSDQALLQRVIAALHHAAGDVVALVAPLRRPGATLMMRPRPSAVSRHRNRRSGQHRNQTPSHAPHQYLLLISHLRFLICESPLESLAPISLPPPCAAPGLRMRPPRIHAASPRAGRHSRSRAYSPTAACATSDRAVSTRRA